MNIEELAQVFDGLLKGLAAGLKEKEKKELAALAGMFRRFPNQGIGDFVRFVEGTFAKERNSVPVLVERIKAFKQGTGEPLQELQASLTDLGATERKKLVTSLGMRAGRTKDDNLKLLQSFLTGHQTETLPPSVPATDLTAEIDRAYAQYEAIKADLAAITVEEMRARFAALSTFSKPVLAGVLSRLGYPAGGSKEAIEAQLLDNLTSIKISLDQTKRIGMGD
jgi:hypothetical protein